MYGAFWHRCCAFVALVFLVGCGGGDSTTGGGSSSSSGPETASTTATAPSAASSGSADSNVEYVELEDADAATGVLRGRFVYEDASFEAAKLAVTKDQEVCGKHDLRDESIVLGPDGGLANVVVQLYLKRGQDAPEAVAADAPEQVALDNHNCRFEPHVCLVQTSQKLLVGNKDPVGHNTKIDSLDNPGINPIIPAEGSFEHEFSVPERRPASVSCSIHPWMKAWVVVTDHPFVAVSGENGDFSLGDLPPGEWTFQVWHEKADTANVTQNGSAVEWSRGRFTVEIKAGQAAELGEVKVKAGS